MNKILVDGEKYFKNNKCSLIIKEDTEIWILNNNSDVTYTLEVLDNCYLKVLDYSDCDKRVVMDVIQHSNSKYDYFHTFKIDDEYRLEIVAHMLGDNNTNNINISGVTKGNVTLSVDGVVKSGTKNNIVNENIKVLTRGGKALIRPMLHVGVQEVIANHNTAISNVRPDVLFYLMSKGIDENRALKLIEDSYIYGLFKDNEEYLNKIKKA